MLVGASLISLALQLNASSIDGTDGREFQTFQLGHQFLDLPAGALSRLFAAETAHFLDIGSGDEVAGFGTAEDQSMYIPVAHFLEEFCQSSVELCSERVDRGVRCVESRGEDARVVEFGDQARAECLHDAILRVLEGGGTFNRSRRPGKFPWHRRRRR